MVYASEPIGGEGPRAALRISKSIVSSALAHYMDRDRAVAMVRIGGQELMVVSQYCDINLRPVPPGLVTVVRFCQEKQIPSYWGRIQTRIPQTGGLIRIRGGTISMTL